MQTRVALLAVSALLVACGDDAPHSTHDDAWVDASAVGAAGVDATVSNSSEAGQVDAGSSGPLDTPITYWRDIVPLFETHCLQCHQQAGIAPFRLDDYAAVKAKAPLIAHSTRARTMPPWDITSDGTCGTFQHSLALTDAQIATIGKWASDGAPEGPPGTVKVPAPDSLSDAKDYPTPLYTPEVLGGALAEADDYRCFLFDSGVTAPSFITGYDVLPGTPEIVHHVVVALVDPDGPADGMPGLTNAQAIDALDKESPDKLGWPCFGLAGEGVGVESVPVVWAPGQGVVKFPGESGVPLTPKHKIVVQVHYNLADPAQRGKTDQSHVRLQLASEVKNIGVFQMPDGLLESMFSPTPDQLAPGLASVLYTWKRSLRELGFDNVEGLKLYGVMPHMHERGHKYQLRIKSGSNGAMQCAADVKRWNFHWQRMYFYQQPWELSPDSELELTCDFDTSDTTSPVLPGWGTRNEMCLATLYFTVPAPPKTP